MEEALKKKLVLLVFLPALAVSLLLAGTLWLALAPSAFSVWIGAKGLYTALAVGTGIVIVAFVICELLALYHVYRMVGQGAKTLLKTTETGRVSEDDVPDSLKDDVGFNVLARRIEQLARGGKEAPQTIRRLAELEEDVRRIANVLEEVSVGSPYVPMPEKEGVSGKIVYLLNRLLPELSELRTASAGRGQLTQAEMRETGDATRELAETAERTFLESTAALVAAREAGKVAAEAEQKLGAIMDATEQRAHSKPQREEIRIAVAKLVEAAAAGMEELTKGLIKANSLSRSSERIANRASVLALNIAVESAKVSMPGMSVLVDEIRKLADFARACSDDSVAVVREIEAQVDRVVRGIHVAQEEVRHKTRLLGLDPCGEESGERETEAGLARTTARLCDSVGRLVSKVQELSKLTERMSRDAKRLSKKTFVEHGRAETPAEGERWKTLPGETEYPEIQTLSDEDLLIEDPTSAEQEGG